MPHLLMYSTTCPCVCDAQDVCMQPTNAYPSGVDSSCPAISVEPVQHSFYLMQLMWVFEFWRQMVLHSIYLQCTKTLLQPLGTSFVAAT